MKKLILAGMVMMVTGCAGAMQAKQEDLAYQKVIELPEQSKDAIFEKSKQWIALRFKSAKAVMEYENKTDGSIIGNGSMARPASSVNMMGAGLITYSMREDIKEGKARLTFNGLTAYGPPGNSEYSILGADIEGMRNHFDGLTADLQKYLLEGKTDNW